mgnify:FL=1
MEHDGAVTAFAPGSIGNLGSGFDVLGMALAGPGDLVTARLCDSVGVTVSEVVGSVPRLPPAGPLNSAGVAAQALLEAVGDDRRGVDLKVDKGLPLAAGMGGSAASAVAAVVAVDRLLELKSPDELLLEAALQGEASAAGAPHPDNAAASLLGGIVMVREADGVLETVRLPGPEELWYALAHPHVELPTSLGRDVLPDSIPLSIAVRQWANVAGLVSALYRGDLAAVGRGTEDLVAEPARAPLIPGFFQVRSAAADAGALGFGVSGSGPSVFALVREREGAEAVSRAMTDAFRQWGQVEADAHVGPANAPGARVTWPEGDGPVGEPSDR